MHILQNTDKCIFVTGRAGTGKSTLLDHFRNNTGKQVVVLASTGVSALNVGGQTIHSFFRFGTDITVDKVTRKKNPVIEQLDTLVIDEVSMVRADLMDCIDKAMRLNADPKQPFGGKQVAFFGDLYQLPPVVKSSERKAFTEKYETCFFYSADVMRGLDYEFVELERIYRQHDKLCIDILNGIRNNTITDELIAALNDRVDPDFIPGGDEFYITLTSRNKTAEQINDSFLNSLKTKKHCFRAVIEGTIKAADMPGSEILSVKVGAQVMFLNNDSEARWVNGTMGVITGVDAGAESMRVRIMDGGEACVTPFKWNLYRYVYDSEKKTIQTETIGSFEQMPVRLAWAITIHKSQGKTFPKLIVDSSGIFASGQIYVALSRCTSLDGLVLRQRIERKHIFTDWRVPKFLTGVQYARSEKKMSARQKIRRIKDVIRKNGALEIVYLKNKDVKSKRRVRPGYVGDLLYKDTSFTGMKAFCYERNEQRYFRVDRILEMKEVDVNPGICV